MNRMIIYKFENYVVFVLCDAVGNPDLSKVPDEYEQKLKSHKWKVYTVSTSRDKKIFADVCLHGFSIQKAIVKFQEKE